MSERLFNIYVPSYGRADTTTTYKFLEYCTYVVRKSQEEEYRNAGVPNILAVEDSEIDSMVKVTNWVIEHTPEQVIAMVDDDMKCFYYRFEKNEKLTDPEVITSEIERIGQLIYDLNIGYCCPTASIVPWDYCSEFTFKGISGGMRWVNKKAFKSRFDEKVAHNCDIDVTLHELLVNRIILQPRYFCTGGGTDTNKGGNSSKKRQDQIDCIERMKQRWGKHFHYDLKSNKPNIVVKR